MKNIIINFKIAFKIKIFNKWYFNKNSFLLNKNLFKIKS